MHNSINKLLFKAAAIAALAFLNVPAWCQNIAGESGNNAITLIALEKKTIPATQDGKPIYEVQEESFDYSNITINTKDLNLNLNFYNYFSASQQYLNVAAGGKAKNDIANIFSTGNVVSEGTIKINYGIRLKSQNAKFKEGIDAIVGNETDYTKLEEPIQNYLESAKIANDLWLVANASFTGSKFKRFVSDSIFSKQVIKETFTAYEFSAGLNYWNANLNLRGVEFLAAITIGAKQSNNFDDLIESTIEDKQTIIDAATSTTRTISAKETIYQGEYKEFIAYPLNLSFYFAPHKLKNLSISIYSTTDISEEIKPKTRAGIGFFFLKNENIFNPVGGINFSLKDAFNVDSSDDHKGTWDKFTISLTTRINIFDPFKPKAL